MNQVQKPRGTKDCYGEEMLKYETIIELLITLSKIYGYQQIITPTFEEKAVFVDSLGDSSEVVHKEFFELMGRNEQKQYVLRPENTASIIRTVNNDKLIDKLPLPIKFFYYGSMFRYERPQAGRWREFCQFGLELIATETITDQVEVFLLIEKFLTILNLREFVKLKVNCLGNSSAKQAWNEQLKFYFQQHLEQLSPLSQKRVNTNPIRILDDKKDQHLDCVKNAPKIQDHLNQEALSKFQSILDLLNKLGIKYEIDHRLVRGFDYYCGLVFEYVWNDTKVLGQSTIIGGGEYQHRSLNFHNSKQTCFGFGLGVDRLVLLLDNLNFFQSLPWLTDCYLANLVDLIDEDLIKLITALRQKGLSVHANWKTLKLQQHFNISDKLKSKYIMVFGQEEQNNRTISIRKKNSNEVKIFKLNETNEIYKIIADNNSDMKRRYEVLDTIMQRKYYAK